MNRVVLLLAATTLTFTATAIYYAHALGVEKARHLLLEVQRTTSAQADPLAGMDSPGASALAVSAGAQAPGKRVDPAEAAVARHHLNQLRDPAGRADRKRQIVWSYREGRAVETKMMGLSDDEMDRYFEAWAERVLENEQRVSECHLDPACDAKALGQAQASASNSELRQMQAELLGPERYARYLAVRDASEERRDVDQIRRRLTAPNAMSDTQAERLVTTLAANRRKFASEAEQNGMQIRQGRGFRRTGILLQGAATPGAADAHAQRMESATRYNQKIIDLASTVLTPGQMTEFNLLQEQAVRDYEEFLQEEEIEDAARKATGSKP